jgi:2-polyprenyl-3-methyl-5-hydroxy-6-metoxy-1,4-benzoquinol methylase
MTEIKNADAIKAFSNAPRALIENFGDEGDITRKYLLNPVLFSLLGDVTGKTILDAGCGQGYLCRLLARKGAKVTGIEPAGPWFTYALQKEHVERLGITYRQEDLSTWSPMLNTFDYVIANMVFMDIPEYLSALRNCIASLKSHGGLIFSLLHPCFEEPGSEWKKKGEVSVRDYFRERAVPQSYGQFIHRSLSTYLKSVIQEGCTLQRVIEPQLEKTIAERHHAERYWSVPGYIVIYASKSFSTKEENP